LMPWGVGKATDLITTISRENVMGKSIDSNLVKNVLERSL